jgi:predicted nucleic acid-binding protein
MSAFWDASAVLHVCVPAQARSRAKALLQSATPVIWWGTPVEVRSALARLNRSGVLSALAYQTSRQKLDTMLSSWRQVQPSDMVRDVAMDLLERFPPRAADALQLAAALVWSRRKAKGRLFVCNDKQLGSAAIASGFEVAET